MEEAEKRELGEGRKGGSLMELPPAKRLPPPERIFQPPPQSPVRMGRRRKMVENEFFSPSPSPIPHLVCTDLTLSGSSFLPLLFSPPLCSRFLTKRKFSSILLWKRRGRRKGGIFFQNGPPIDCMKEARRQKSPPPPEKGFFPSSI